MGALLTKTYSIAGKQAFYSCLSINTKHADEPLVAVLSLKLIDD